MYNQDIKQKYIDSLGNSSTAEMVSSVFKKIDNAIESKFNQDIAEMSPSNIILGFESMSYVSYSTLRTDIGFLKAYARWYCKNIKDIDIDEFEKLFSRDVDLSNSLRSNLIKDEGSLLELLKDAPPEEGYYEAPVFCLLWIGLEMKNIINLKNEDVCLIDDNMFVKYGKISKYISSPYIKDVLLKYSRAESGSRQHRGEWIVYPDDLGYFIKNFSPISHKSRGKRLTVDKVQRKIAAYDPAQLKATNVLLSGRFFRLMENEKRMGSLDLSIIKQEFNINKRTQINDIFALYECYKKAFWN